MIFWMMIIRLNEPDTYDNDDDQEYITPDDYGPPPEVAGGIQGKHMTPIHHQLRFLIPMATGRHC